METAPILTIHRISTKSTPPTTVTVTNIYYCYYYAHERTIRLKFTCNKQNLVEAVTNVQRAVSTKSTIPALEGIFIKAKADQLELCGYNLELGIKTYIEAQVEDEGEVVLNAKLFSDIVRSLPDEKVSIAVDDRMITEINSGKSDFSIIGLKSEDFPELPFISGAQNIKLSSLVLKSMIKQTLYAISENDSKPVHTGALFDIANQEIRLVSVDGYRLALRKEKINTNEQISFVVPKKTLMEVIKLIPDLVDEITLKIADRHIIFEIDNYCVISRLLEGEFLDYSAAIPIDFRTELKVNTRKLIESTERVSLLVTDRLRSPIRCVLINDEVKMSCVTSIGKASDEFKCPIKGEDVEVGFNNRYLVEALKNVDTDEVVVQLNGPLSPIKILPSSGDSFLFLVLPVRLQAE